MIEQDGEGSANHELSTLRDLAEGAYAVEISARDEAGNSVRDEFGFVLDCTLPDVQLDSPQAQDWIAAAAAAPLEIIGTASDAHFDHYQLRLARADAVEVAGEPLGDLIAHGSTPVQSALLHAWRPAAADGEHRLGLIAVDRAGNARALWQPLRLDGSLPQAQILDPANGATVTPQLSLFGTASDPNFDRYELQLASPEAAQRGEWSTVAVGSRARESQAFEQLVLPDLPRIAVRLRVFDQAGQSASDRVDLVVDGVPPPPAQLAASPEPGRTVAIRWTGAEAADLAGFRLFRDGHALNDDLLSERSFLDQVDIDGTYRYEVRAFDHAGNESEASNRVAVRVDATAPDTLLLQPADGERIRAEYDVVGSAYAEDDFDGYTLDALLESSGLREVLIAAEQSVLNRRLFRLDTRAFAEAAALRLRLSSRDTSGNESADEARVTIDNLAPAAPSGLQAQRQGSDVELRWAPNQEPDLLGYLLYRSGRLLPVTASQPDDLRLLAIAQASHLDAAAPDGRLAYQLYAIDSAGNISPPSASAEIDFESGPPLLRILSPQSGERIGGSVAVRAISDDLDVASVRFRARPVGGAWEDLGAADQEAPWAASLTLDDADYGDYELQAIASDRGGLVDPDPPAVTVSYVDLVAPSVPTGVQAQADGSTVRIRWGAVSDDDLAGYPIEWQGADGQWTALGTGAAAASELTHADVALGETRYRVRAEDRWGNLSAWSSIAVARVHRPQLQAPFTPIADAAITLRGYTDVAGTAELEVQRESASGMVWPSPLPLSADFTLADVPLEIGRSTAQLRVVDAGGNRSLPAAVRVRRGTRPAAPVGLSGELVDGSLRLRWNAAADPTLAGYRLYHNQGAVDDRPLAPAQIEASVGDADAAIDGESDSAWVVVVAPGRVDAPAQLDLELLAPRLIGRITLRWASEAEQAVAYTLRVRSVDGETVTLREVDDAQGAEQVIQLADAYLTDRISLLTRRASGSGQRLALAEIEIGERVLLTEAQHVQALGEGRHRFRVAAVSALGFEGPPSEVWQTGVGDDQPPAALMLRGSVVAGDARLDWDASSAEDLSHYLVIRDGQVRARVEPTPQPIWTDPQLRDGSYAYQLRVVDRVGNESEDSNLVRLQIARGGPAAPVALTVAPGASAGSLDIRWQAGSGAGSAALRYRLSRALSESPLSDYASVAETNQTQLSETGLDAGVRYHYAVRGIDALGNVGAPSVPASGVPTAAAAADAVRMTYPARSGDSALWPSARVDVCGVADAGSARVDLFRDGRLQPPGGLQSAEQTLGPRFGEQRYLAVRAALSRSGRYAVLREAERLWVHELDGDALRRSLPSTWSRMDFSAGAETVLGWDEYQRRFERIAVDSERHEQYDARGFHHVTAIQVAPDDRHWLVSGARGGRVGLWLLDAESDSVEAVVGPAGEEASADGRFYWLADGRQYLFLVGSTLLLGDVDGRPPLRITDQVSALPLAIAASGDAVYLHRQVADEHRIVRLETDALVEREVLRSARAPRAFAASPDGRELAVAFADRVGIERFSLDGAPIGQWDVGATAIDSLRWVAGGRLLIGDSAGQWRVLSPAGVFCHRGLRVLPGSQLFHAQAISSAGTAGPLSLPLQLFREGETTGYAELEVGDLDLRFAPAVATPDDATIAYLSVHNRGDERLTGVVLNASLRGPEGGERVLPAITLASIDGQASAVASIPLGQLARAGRHLLSVQVDAELQIDELREDNNSASAGLMVVVGAQPTLDVVAAAPRFAAGEAARGEVRLHNPGPALQGRVQLSVLDDQGEPVTVLPEWPLANLAFAGRATQPWRWESAAALAGPYRLRAELFDSAGGLRARSEVRFLIEPDADIALDLQTDRSRYHAGDSIRLSAALEYRAGNALLGSTALSVHLIDPSGAAREIWQGSAGTLAPGYRSRRSLSASTADLTPGAYRLQLQLRAGELQWTRALELAIDSAATAPSLQGSLRLAPEADWVLGRPSSLRAQLTATGSKVLEAVDARIRVLGGQPATLLREQHSALRQVAAGSIELDPLDLAPLGQQPATMLAVLEARNAHDQPWQRLAQRVLHSQDRLPPEITVLAPGSTPLRSPAAVRARVVDRHSYVTAAALQLNGERWRALDAQPAGDLGQLLDGLPDGPHQLRLRASDAWGNEVISAPQAFEIDSTPPRVLLVGVEAGRAYAQPVRAQVQVEDRHADRVELQLDGRPYEAGSPIAGEGAHQLQALATDRAGNRSEHAVAFSIDTRAPALSVLSPADGSQTSEAAIDITALSEAEADITLSAGGVVQRQSAAANGIARFAAVPLLPGSNRIELQAVDAAGNASTMAAIEILRSDAGALRGTIQLPAAAIEQGQGLSAAFAVINTGTSAVAALVRAEALDARGALRWQQQWTLDARPGIETNLQGQVDGVGEFAGSALLRLSASVNGRWQLLDARSIEVRDLVAPALARLAPEDQAVLGLPWRLAATASDAGSGVAEVRYRLHGLAALPLAEIDDGQFVAERTDLPDGDYELSLQARDRAGNLGPELGSRFAIDTVAPEVLITGVEADAVRAAAVSVAISVRDAHPEALEVSLNGQPASAELRIDSEGHHLLRAVARDQAGNLRDVERRFSIDLTPPTLVVLRPLEAEPILAALTTVVGRSEARAWIELSYPGGSLRGQADAAGGFVFEAVPLDLGGNRFSLQATDRAGHRSEPLALTVERRDDPQDQVSAELRADAGRAPVGRPIGLELRLHNASAAARLGYPVKLLVQSLDEATPRHDSELSLDLDATSTRSASRSLITEGWPASDYLARLLVRSQDQWRVAASTAFTLWDPTPPAIRIEQPAAGSAHRAPVEVQIASERADPLQVRMRFAGGAWVTAQPSGASGRYAAQLALPADGAAQIEAEAVDGNGLRSAMASVAVEVDTVAPQIRLQGLPDRALHAEPLSLQIDTEDRSAVTLSVLLNGESRGSRFEVSADGTHRLEVIARDAAGNTSRLERVFTLDRRPPVVEFLQPQSGAVLDQHLISVHGRTEPLATLEIAVGSERRQLSADAHGQFVLPRLPLQEGENLISAVATDAAGNRGEPATLRVERRLADSGRLLGRLVVAARATQGDTLPVQLLIENPAALMIGPLAIRLQQMNAAGERRELFSARIEAAPRAVREYALQIDTNAWSEAWMGLQLDVQRATGEWQRMDATEIEIAAPEIGLVVDEPLHESATAAQHTLFRGSTLPGASVVVWREIAVADGSQRTEAARVVADAQGRFATGTVGLFPALNRFVLQAQIDQRRSRELRIDLSRSAGQTPQVPTLALAVLCLLALALLQAGLRQLRAERGALRLLLMLTVAGTLGLGASRALAETGPALQALIQGEDAAAAIAMLQDTAEKSAPAAAPVAELNARTRFAQGVAALSQDRTASADERLARLRQLQALKLLAAREFDQDLAGLAVTPSAALQQRAARAREQWLRRAERWLAKFSSPPTRYAGDDGKADAKDSESASPPIFGLQPLPVHHPSASPRTPRRTPSILPVYAAGATDPAPLAEDFESTLPLGARQAIADQAEALGYDYLRILDFMRTEIRTQWYAGAQKGALATLHTRAGNDVDQASLLIALLRASSAAARYLQGVVRVPSEPLAQMMGVPEAQLGRALAAAGIAHEAWIAGGRIAGYDIEQVWVAARLPIGDYRGSARSDADPTWLPLMPALKPARFAPGDPMLRLAGIDAQRFRAEYLSAPAAQLPLPTLRDRLLQHYAGLSPAVDIDQRRPQHYGTASPIAAAPSSTPYPVQVVNAEYARLLDEQVLLLRVQMPNPEPAAAPLLDVTLEVADLLHRQLSLAYQAAEVDDQTLVAQAGGIAAVPLYLLRLRPVLLLDGRPVAVGEGAIEAGTEHVVQLSLLGPVASATFSQRLRAGGLAALAVDAQADRPPPRAPDAPFPAESIGRAARVLGHLAARYALEWQQAEAELADFAGVSLFRPLPSLSLLIPQYRVEQHLGLPHSLQLQGVALDALAHPVEAVAHHHADDAAEFMRLSALHGSALEHQLFEQQWGVASLSADKAIQQAAAAGHALQTLEGVASLAGLNGHETDVRSAIGGWLQRGYRVAVVQQPISADSWTGSAWWVDDPVTGESGYFVSGRYAGGVTVVPPFLWALQDLAALLAEPYAPLPNPDALAGALIQIDPQATSQMGVAGGRAPRDLQARVTDAAGAPVRGARVRFTVTSGNALLGALRSSAAASVTALTDARGFARVAAWLGEAFPAEHVYVVEADQRFPQKVGANLVLAAVATREGELQAGRGFDLYARPAALAKLETLPLFAPFNRLRPNELLPGLGSYPFTVRASDAYGNPISNAPVAVSVADDYSVCTQDIISNEFRSSQVFDPQVCAVPTDSVSAPDCASDSVGLLTRPGGAVLMMAPTNRPGIPIALTAQQVVGSGAVAVSAEPAPWRTSSNSGLDCSGLPTAIRVALQWGYTLNSDTAQTMSARFLSHADYNWLRLIDAAAPGDMFPARRRIAFYFGRGGHYASWDGMYDEEDLHPSNFRISNGKVTAVRMLAKGVWDYELQADRLGIIRGHIEVASHLDPAILLPAEYRTFRFLEASVIDLPPPQISPNPLSLSARQTSRTPLLTEMLIEGPDDYVGRAPQLRIESDGGDELAQCSGLTGGEDFSCQFAAGTAFDPQADYAVSSSINAGTPFAMQSDPQPITLSRGMLIAQQLLRPGQAVPALARFEGVSVGSDMKATHEVDVATGYVCDQPARLAFALGSPGRMGVSLISTDAHGNPDRVVRELLPTEQRPPGVYVAQLGPLEAPIGEYFYEVKSEAADGSIERIVGRWSSRIIRRDSMTLAHSLVKGIDLFDGHALISRQDIALPGRGPGLGFARTYASHAGDQPTALGRGWHSSLDAEVQADSCGTLLVTGSAGQGQRFRPLRVEDGVRIYAAMDGFHGQLRELPSGEHQFIARDGSLHHFGGAGIPPGRLAYIEDPNGNRVSYGYRRFGSHWYPDRIEDGGGRALQLSYEVKSFEQAYLGDADQQEVRPVLVSISGPLDLRIDFRYSDAGNLSEVRRCDSVSACNDDAPLQERYEYLDLGGQGVTRPDGSRGYVHFGFRLIKAIDGLTAAERRYRYEPHWNTLGDPTLRQYVPEQRVVEFTEADTGVTRFSYQGLRGQGPLRSEVRDARGATTRYLLNDYGAAVETSGPAGTTRTEWDFAARQPAKITDALGTVTEFSYDDAGNTTRQRIVHRAGTAEQRWEYHPASLFRDARGQPLPIRNRLRRAVDARGIETTYSVDARGNLIGQTRSGSSEIYRVEENGDRSSIRDAMGALLQQRFDDHGQLIEQRDDIGSRWSARFDARGRRVQQTDALGRITDFSFDALDRPLRTTHPAVTDALSISGRAVEQVEYHDTRRRVRSIDARGVISESSFDAMGRLLHEVQALGRPEQRERRFSYDLNGNRSIERNWRGDATELVYDQANRLIERRAPLGLTQRYTYDAEGHVLSEQQWNRLQPTERMLRSEYRYEHPLYLRTEVRRIGEGGPLVSRVEYDLAGNVRAEIDALGQRVEHDYDSRGRRISSRYPEHRELHFEYDLADRKRFETLRDARQDGRFVEQRREWAYDLRGRLHREVDAMGQPTLTEYDAADNPIARIDARGARRTRVFDERNRLSAERGPLPDQLTDYGLDHRGNQIRIHDAAGGERQQQFDGLNRLIASEDQISALSVVKHDADDNPIESTDGLGRITRSSWDALGREVERQLPAIDGQARTLSWRHDVHGQVIGETDAEGHTSTHGYDDFGRKVESRGPPVAESIDGHRVQLQYDGNDRLVQTTDARGVVTVQGYDGLGRRMTEEVRGPAGSSERYAQRWSFDVAGNPIEHVDRAGELTETRFDANNRPVSRRRLSAPGAQHALEVTTETLSYDEVGNLVQRNDALGRPTRYSYDLAGRKLSESRLHGWERRWTWRPFDQIATAVEADGITSEFIYDTRQQLIETRNGLGLRTFDAYDAVGRRISRQLPGHGASSLWRYEFDAGDRLVAVTSPEGARSEYRYDLDDQRTRIRDAERRDTHSTWDAAHRLVSQRFADDEQVHYRHDGNGNVVERAMAGRVVRMVYDALNREIERSYQPGPEDARDAAQPVSVSTEYDGNGRPVQLRQVSGESTLQIRRQWDALGRLLSETDAFGQQTRWRYDAAGNRLQRIDGGGSTDFESDVFDRVVGIRAEGALPIRLGYTPEGRLQEIAHGDIAASRYRYDRNGRLEALIHTQTGSQVASYVFGYDDNGNRIREDLVDGEGQRQSTYRYDDDDRLVGITVPETHTDYTLDGTGNRLTETVVDRATLQLRQQIRLDYNLRNQLIARDDAVSGEATRYRYDRHGNLVEQSVGSVVHRYRHNAQDRLASVSPDGGDANTTHYRYEPSGLRIEKRNAASATRFHYDQGQLRFETNVLGNPITAYEFAAGHVLAQHPSSGARLHFLHDAQRSPVRLIDPAGATAGRTRYDVWGVRQLQTGTATAVGYTGYYADAESGLNYAKARHQLPGIGRFLQVDPWEGDTNNPVTLNKYLYANGNPLTYMDPTGKYAEAGHYYTTYYIALRAGYSNDDAQTLAFYSQIQDESDDLDAIAVQADYLWSFTGLSSTKTPLPTIVNMLKRNAVQREGHALSGRLGSEEASITLGALRSAQNNDLIARGLLIHRLADTFAHRRVDVPKIDAELYDTGAGHFLDSVVGEHPDLIQNRPDRYLSYVETLARELGVQRGMSEAEAEALAASVSADLSQVALIPRLMPGTNRIMWGRIGFPGIPSSVVVSKVPAYYYSDAELEDLSVNRLRKMIEAEGGKGSYAPEAPTPAWKLYFPIFEERVGDSLAAISDDLPYIDQSESSVYEGFGRAASILRVERAIQSCNPTVVSEGKSGAVDERSN